MKDDAKSLIRPGPPPRHRGGFGSLPRIAKRGGATQTNETFRAPAAPFGTVRTPDRVFPVPLVILRSTSAVPAFEGCIQTITEAEAGTLSVAGKWA